MIKKFLILVFLILAVINFKSGNVYADQNLILNDSFEELTLGMPKNWHTDVYNLTGSETKFYVDSKSSHSGKNSMVIESKQPEDAKIIQKISVKPDTVYKLLCWVKAEGVGVEGKGANISVLGITDTSLDVVGDSTAWTKIELYGRTAKDQKEMEVTARLGGYGNLNTGKAYFDDFSVEEVKSVPENIKVVSLYENSSSSNNIASQNKIKIPVIKTILTLTVFLLFFYTIYLKLVKKYKSYSRINLKTEKILLIAVLMLALILRLIIAPLTSGHTTDINTFKAWATAAADKGLASFYTSGMFSDYPPGYVYILYFIGKIQSLFSIGMNSEVMLLLIKLPPIIADIVCTLFIYKIARKKIGAEISLALALLYALNPAVIINSASWGQVDGFFTMFILLVVYYAFKERLIKASIIFTLAVLIKPQALIITPVLIFAFQQKKNLKQFLYSAGYSILLFILLILPFSLKQNIFWIADKYITTLSSYPYASINAFNLFTFTGGNWVPVTNKLMFLSYNIWGMLFIVLIVTFSGYVFLNSKHPAKLLYISVFIPVSVFVLSSKMHERYMFPAVILSLLWYIFVREKRILFIFAILTSTVFINEDYVLQGALKQVYNISISGVVSIVALTNLCLLIYLIIIGIGYAKNTEYKEISEEEKDIITERKIEEVIKKEKVTFVKKDYLLMAILVVFYSVVAFINLGSTRVPQSFWQPAAVGDSFYVDLGQEKDIKKIAYYFGIGQDSSYNVSFSKDAVNWFNIKNFVQESIYNWKTIEVNEKARYIKVTTNTAGVMMNEIGFFGNNTDKPYEIKNVVNLKVTLGGKGSPQDVFDEQSTVNLKSSYMTGMIFDEIYHARTAYEHLNKLQPYEWTHPPLGKLFIAVGILFLGMDPLGWRIVGTIFGIVMIPFMYFLGKRLFKKTEFAFLSGFLMTFDFMHFTQTRIATVDVYAVFFIILMYYFMYKYTEVKVYDDKGFKDSLLQLGLCGLFLGLGAASKWICLYSAAGLAIIFFKDLHEKYNEYKFSKKYIGKEDVDRESEKYHICNKISEKFKANTLKTIVYCIPVFIILPLIIYILSYIPYMMVPGQNLESVFKLQGYMYDYHTNLVATHPFASPWYQWPFIIKPIWYYSGEGLSPGKISSIVSMGNPAIWWTGVIAAVAVFIIGIRNKDKKAFFIIVGGLSQYIPWILVPRLTFIYHYFATVPFIMLCIVYCAAYIKEKYHYGSKIIKIYMIITALLFVIFYPIISGAIIDRTFAYNFLKWFNTWIF